MSSSKSCVQCGSALMVQERGDYCRDCLEATTAHPTKINERNAPLGQDNRFGDYELMEEIAQGGMGVVYKARQVSLNRIVALKMVRADRLATPDDIKRFETEALASAQLQHPHIVSIYDIGQVDGQQFFTMNYVAGPTLTRFIEEKSIDPKRCAQYMVKVAEAIHYAHQRGVLHRDIKPSNVLIDLDDEPRVADFGLAKLMSMDSEMTASGAVMGSPSFMSPEQARGNQREIGVQSDVYGLGALLYALLCGRPPFRGKFLVDTLRLVVDTEPVPPRALVPHLPRDLEIIVLKCLHKIPDKRYSSALELANDLRHFLQGDPITARSVGKPERMWRWCQRKPLLAAVSGLALLLLLVVSIGSPIVAYRLNKAKILAQEGELNARRNAYAADMRAVQTAIEESRFGYALQLLDSHRPLPGQKDIRNWEWRHFWQLCQSDDFATLTRHDDFIYAVHASSTGKWIVSWSANCEIKVWSMLDHQEVYSMRPGSAPPPYFSPDEKFLAIPTASGDIRILAMDRLEESGPAIKHPGNLQAVGFHPDGRHVLTFGDDIIRYWDLDSRTQVRQLRAVAGQRYALSRDWRMLAVSNDGHLTLWDEQNGVRWTVDTDHNSSGSQPVQLEFSPDENLLAVSMALNPGSGWSIQIWNVNTCEKKTEFRAHSGIITDLAFSPDGKYLASSSYDQTTQIWETRNWQQVTVLKGHNSPVFGVSFLPDGKRLVTSSQDGTVRLWELFRKVQDRRLELDEEFCDQLIGERRGTASPHGAFLAMLRSDGSGIVVDSLRLEIIKRFQLPFQDTVRLALGPKGAVLACGRKNGVITLWDPDAGEVGEFSSHKGNQLMHMAFSPDGKWLSVVEEKGDFILWDLSTGNESETWRDHARAISPLRMSQFSPDSRLIAWGHADGALSLWDVNSSQPVAELVGHEHGILAIAFSNDGTLLGSTCLDSPARIWDLRTRKVVATFSGNHSSFFRIGFSPDGSRVFLSEWNHGHIMDVETKREVARLQSYYPMFLNEDAVLGLSQTELWIWRPSAFSEIDAL